jgi:hypothetical protein
LAYATCLKAKNPSQPVAIRTAMTATPQDRVKGSEVNDALRKNSPLASQRIRRRARRLPP